MADYRVFINVIGGPVTGSDKKTCGGPCSVYSYVLQQMPHPHSKEAMNNYDNHGTMASFINARGAQTWGWLGCLSIFCNQDLFLWSKTSMSAEWCHRWVYSCPSFCCLSFFLSLFIFSFYFFLLESDTQRAEHVLVKMWLGVKMISTVPEAVIQQPPNIRDFPDSIYNEILFTLHSPLHRFPVPLIARNLYT